jgi:hypothetical protein
VLIAAKAANGNSGRYADGRFKEVGAGASSSRPVDAEDVVDALSLAFLQRFRISRTKIQTSQNPAVRQHMMKSKAKLRTP